MVVPVLFTGLAGIISLWVWVVRGLTGVDPGRKIHWDMAYAKTLILAAIVVLVAGQKHAAFLLVFVALFLLVSFMRKPEERRPRRIRMAIWTIAVLAVVIVHWYWATESRRDADSAVAAVLAYQAKTGSLPNTLAAAGLDEAELDRKWKLVYLVRNGEPSLLLPRTFAPFEAYSYDFRSKQWQSTPD